MLFHTIYYMVYNMVYKLYHMVYNMIYNIIWYIITLESKLEYYNSVNTLLHHIFIFLILHQFKKRISASMLKGCPRYDTKLYLVLRLHVAYPRPKIRPRYSHS